MNKLIITGYNNKIITAVFNDKRMTDVLAEDRSNSSYVGNIYVGRVENVVPNINAAFVEFTKGVKGYLSLNENPNPVFINKKNTDKVCMGDIILIQVEREPVKTKMAVLTTKLNLSGKYTVITDNSRDRIMVSDKIKNKEKRHYLKGIAEPYVSEGYGIIMRTNCESASDTDIINELEVMTERYRYIYEHAKYMKAFTCMYKAESGFIGVLKNIRFENLDEIVTDDKEIYNQVQEYLADCKINNGILRFYEDSLLPLSKLYSIDARIKEALSERVWLKSGGYLVIQPTEALAVIDVNTGKYSGSRKDRDATFFKINMEAAIEIARQIRLRNYSGIIVIDFIDMDNDEYNRELIAGLKAAVADDPVKTTYVDMTALGLVEITRKKVRKPLYEQLK